MSELHEQKYELVVGRCDGGRVQYPKNTGFALRRGEELFYMLKLNMFPGATYYLSKNHGENPNYTLFAKMLRDDKGVRFQNPIGAARLRTDLKTHLEIRFNLFDRRVYMSLFPAQ